MQPRGAWLVWDPNDRRDIRSGLQLFGAATWWVFWRDGYEALSLLDDNDDGILDGAELDGLALWNDANSDGRSSRAEVTTVARAGIIAIRCRPLTHPTGIPYHPEGVVFGNETRPTFDWNSPMQPALPPTDSHR